MDSRDSDGSGRTITGIFLAVALLVIGGGIAVWVTVGEFGPRERETQHEAYRQDPVTVEVDTGAGNVTIRTGTDGEVAVERELRWYGDDKPVSEEVWEGATLRIAEKCTGNCHIDYTIVVPADTVIAVDSDSGDIEVSDVDNQVALNADSGDVEVSDVAGTLTVTTSSGNIAADRISAAEATVESSSGDVALDFSTAPTLVTAVSDSGGVDVHVPHDADGYRVTANSDSGDLAVHVTVNENSTRLITATTDSGDVSVGSA